VFPDDDELTVPKPQIQLAQRVASDTITVKTPRWSRGETLSRKSRITDYDLRLYIWFANRHIDRQETDGMNTSNTALVCGLLLSTFSFIQHCPAAETLTLAKDGRTDTVIVLRNEATAATRETAGILADHLKQICGADFPVVTERDLRKATVHDQKIVSSGSHRTFILVGESKLATALGASSRKLGPGGVLIRTFPNALALLGPDKATPTDRSGTRYAVTTFLEDFLGCRFLWPGELGKVVPQRKTIDIPSTNYSFTPVIRQRRIRMASGYGDRKAEGVKRLGFKEADFHRFNKPAMETKLRDGGWTNWHRLGGSLRLASGHSFGYMWEKHKDKHPEWFAVQPDGTRDQSRSPDRSRLCVSNLKLIEEIARDRIERLNKSDIKSVSIGPNDGGQTSFCRCDKCRKLDPINSRKLSGGRLALTDRYVYFWNEIAKRVTKVHPDAWLTADAYGIYASPPVLRKLHPNIAIRYVGVKYNDDTKRKQDMQDWDAWSKVVKNIYFRPNLLLSGRRQGTPMVYIHKLGEDLKYMAHNSLIGTDFDSCCHHWATQGLNYYICAKLLWNPDLNIDKLLDDYCRSGFGSGADSVKKYFLRIEAITNELAAKKLTYTEPYTPKVITELRACLTAAGKATRNEPVAHKRVAFLRSGLEYTDAYVAAFRIIRRHEAQKPRGGRLPETVKQQIRQALDNNWLASRDIFENHHLAVNVPTVAWGSWSYFGRYYWNNPSPEVREKAQK